MDIEKKYRWSLTGFIIMIVLNLGILITLWMNIPDANRTSDRGNRLQDSRAMHKYFQERLNLTDAQLDTVSTLRRSHYRDMRENRRQLDEKRKAYVEFIMNSKAGDAGRRDSLMKQLTLQYTQMEREMYSHMREMRGVLNEDQQQVFGDMMKRAFVRDRNQERTRHHRQ